MKKTFLTKLIVIMLVFMSLINGILPTEVVFASETEGETIPKSYDTIKITKETEGWYLVGIIKETHYSSGLTGGVGSMSVNYGEEDGEVVFNFGNDNNSIYLKDTKEQPEYDGRGRVYLKEGEYVYLKKVSQVIPGQLTIYYTLKLYLVEEAPNLDEKLTHFADVNSHVYGIFLNFSDDYIRR